MTDPGKASPLGEEPRLLSIPPLIRIERLCPQNGTRATLALAPYPRRRVWAHRIGLISTEEFVVDLLRHVGAEARPGGPLTVEGIEAIEAEWWRAKMRSMLRMIAIAVAFDMLVGGVALCLGLL